MERNVKKTVPLSQCVGFAYLGEQLGKDMCSVVQLRLGSCSSVPRIKQLYLYWMFLACRDGVGRVRMGVLKLKSPLLRMRSCHRFIGSPLQPEVDQSVALHAFPAARVLPSWSIQLCIKFPDFSVVAWPMCDL